MVGSAAIKQGRSANRKNLFFFGLIHNNAMGHSNGKLWNLNAEKIEFFFLNLKV